MEYQYPVDYTWTTDEIVDVIHFFEVVEKAYESKVLKEDVMKAYRRFKEIVPGKADEKNYTDDFQESSGYSAYLVVKKAKETADGGWIQMK